MELWKSLNQIIDICFSEGGQCWKCPQDDVCIQQTKDGPILRTPKLFRPWSYTIA